MGLKPLMHDGKFKFLSHFFVFISIEEEEEEEEEEKWDPGNFKRNLHKAFAIAICLMISNRWTICRDM